MFIFEGIAAFLLAAVSTFALPTNVTNVAKSYEINCKGSGKCDMSDFGDVCMGKIHGALKFAVEKGFGDTRYDDGKHITCTVNCCAFFQHGAEGTVWEAFYHVENMIDHGCKGCGSIPHGGGELTLNYVSNPNDCLEGHLCPAKEGYACAWDSQDDPTAGFKEGQNCDKGYKPDPQGGCSIPTLCHFYGPDDPGDPYYTGDGQGLDGASTDSEP